SRFWHFSNVARCPTVAGGFQRAAESCRPESPALLLATKIRVAAGLGAPAALGLRPPALGSSLRAPTGLAAPAALGSILRGRDALEKEAEAVVALGAGHRNSGSRLARDEAALRLVAQHRDELGAVVGFGAQGLVRDDDRGSRHRGRRDAVEHILRDGD